MSGEGAAWEAAAWWPEPAAFALLGAEAGALAPSAGRASYDDIVLTPDGQTLRGPRQHGFHQGPVLQQLHEEVACAWVRAALRPDLAPTRCAYLYLDAASRIGLHVDIATCSYTVLLRISGEPVSLRLFAPQPDPTALLSFSVEHGAFPPGGREMALPLGQGLAFRGCEIPHCLDPVGGEAVVATLCFSVV